MNSSLDQLLTRGVANVYPSLDAARAKLLERPATFYLGLDPTGPTLHLGHIIVIRKLAELQKLGHHVVLLIGDFTGMIGDPTDKKATRKRLTREEVLENARLYQSQASRFLSFDGPNPARLAYNSEWLAKMSFADVVELSAHFTVQQMLERDMFEKRLSEQKPIYLHEFLYPLMQGYDSVALDVDGEVGGNDQTFNMLCGRTLLKEIKGKEKLVITMKLLADASGVKMGKSEGNMVALTDEPNEMFGKVMSWTDGMILPAFELVTGVSNAELDSIRTRLEQGENPRNLKELLAHTLVSELASIEEADAAKAHFASLFQAHALPDEMETFVLQAPTSIVDLLVAVGFASSKGEARRLLEGKGIYWNQETVESVEQTIDASGVLQKGKRAFVRIEAHS